jgi:Arc/MetJ-type ribon-helix-helix transcriptional regulator
MLNKHNDNIFHTELKNIDYICIMEKRKRYTVQIKTEISQVAAYFIDQIVKESNGRFKSISDFVRVTILKEIDELHPGLSRYYHLMPKRELEALNNTYYPRSSVRQITEAYPVEILNNSNPVGNGNRNRYTVQVRTELSETANDFLGFIFEDNEYSCSRSDFLRGVLINKIVKFKPKSIEYLSVKEKGKIESFPKSHNTTHHL